MLLYEILTDHRPFHLAGMSQAEMARVITEHDPPRPSTIAPREIARQLAGDIDTIILKAMHKLPERRYGSAQELAKTSGGTWKAGRYTRAAIRLIPYEQVFQAQSCSCAGSIARVIGVICRRRGRRVAARRRDFQRTGIAEAFWRDPRAGEFIPGRTGHRAGAIAGVDNGSRDVARKVLHYLDQLAKDQVDDSSLQRELAVAYERL